MSQILVVDDSPLCSDLLAEVLRAKGYAATPCTSATARTHISHLRPAVLILEISGAGMPLLQSLRTSEAYNALPVIVLTDQTSREAIVHAAGLGVRDYILKSRFNLAELLTRIRKHVTQREVGEQASGPTAAATNSPAATATPRASSLSARQAMEAPSAAARDDKEAAVRREAQSCGIALLTREQTLNRMEKATIKTLPGAVGELMALVNSPRCTVMDVAQALRQDPVLSSRVLQVANSAAFASQRARISTVEEAVKHIGIATVRNLIATIGVYETFACGAAGQSMLQSWQHSLAVAKLMEKLTPADDANPPGVPYVVGLCHDLGDLVLQQYLDKECQQVAELAQKTGSSVREVQGVFFGLSHSELSLAILGRLGLPGVVTAPIQEVLERSVHRTSAGAGSLMARALRIANVYAHGLMLSAAVDEPVLPLSKLECRQTFGNAMPSVDDQLIRAEAVMTAATLAGLSARELAQAAEQPIPRRSLRICYVRHDDYAELDPLHALLKLTSQQVDVLTRLPANPEFLQEADAIVIALRRSTGADETSSAIAQLGRLLQVRSVPALLLSGCAEEYAGLPSGVAVARLPISAKIWNEFQGRISPNVAKRAA
jgi:HD-like signal output (HDOD) protein/DNA-binding response OmpR family regulator